MLSAWAVHARLEDGWCNDFTDIETVGRKKQRIEWRESFISSPGFLSVFFASEFFPRMNLHFLSYILFFIF